MRRITLLLLLPLLLPLAGCIPGASVAAAITYSCNSGSAAAVAKLAGQGKVVSPSALDAAFARLDRQPRVDLRQTVCDRSFQTLRYLRPDRMQFVAWLDGAFRDPRETQIGNRIGYIGHMYPTRWVGMGVTAHRLLLPDAWRSVPSGRRSLPTFYMLSPPDAPVIQISLRTLEQGNQQLFVERWRGVLNRCPATAMCDLPNLDPRSFVPFTAVLRVDRDTGLPISLVTVAQAFHRSRGKGTVPGPILVSQATFQYTGTFSIQFVKG